MGQVPKATGRGGAEVPKATGRGGAEVPKATGRGGAEVPKATGRGGAEVPKAVEQRYNVPIDIFKMQVRLQLLTTAEHLLT